MSWLNYCAPDDYEYYLLVVVVNIIAC